MNRSIPILFAIAILTSGCQTNKEIVAKIDHSYQPRSVTSKPEHLAALANAKLALESRGSEQAANKLGRLWAESPEIAEFALEHNLFYKSSNAAYEVTKEEAMRLLLDIGRFDLMDDYQRMVYKQQSGGSFFRIEYVMSVAAWVAENRSNTAQGAWSQRALFRYYRHGCSTPYLQENKSGRSGSTLGCDPRPDLAWKWYESYRNNAAALPADKIELAIEMADNYFERSKYAEAAGWYLEAVYFASQDGTTISSQVSSEARQRVVNRSIIGFAYGGKDLHESILDALRVEVKRHERQLNKAKRRLALIRDAGIKTVPLQG